jgi:cytochrome c biogenesis protein ResB
LQKFTIGTDPGTTKAASYASDVRLKLGPNEISKDTYHISMNEPLKHGGYTFYQASYQMEQGKPPVSVFSVNYDPGRSVKYLGSLLIVIGVMLMFYLNPQYWNILFGRKS